MNIVFLLSNIPNPRFNKRIQEFSKWANVQVICIRRINMDIFTLKEIEGVKYHIRDMDMPSAASMWRRAVASIEYWKFVRQTLNEMSPDIIYTHGIDMLMIASNTCKGAKICFEVSDLREYTTRQSSFISIQGFYDRILRQIERHLARRISLLVVTSQKFYDVYYSAFIDKSKVIEIPNMPMRSAFDNYKPKTDGDFTVGFVGGLRYLNQMKMLVDSAGKLGINVIFSGATDAYADSNFQVYCKDKPWVKFTGKYDFARDIANIYGKLDCVYSVYDASNFNVRIALPNKLYEAVICHLPIIVAKDTYLEELVKNWGVGVSVGFDDENELESVLSLLKKKDNFYQGFVKNCIKKQDKIDAQKYLDLLSYRVMQLI